jgi:mono/diheme cytochrome c family protein
MLRKAAFVNKLFFATCTILFPLVGCTGMVGEDSSAFGGGGAGSTAGGSSSAAGQSTGFGGAGNSGSTAGAESIAGVGSGGVSAVGGTTAAGGSSNGGTCSADVLPADVQTMLNSKCATCHGATPLAGLPSLVNYAALIAPSKTDPTKTNAALALVRIQSTTAPMPPAPGARVSASDIAALQAFVTQGYPKPVCPTGAGGAGGGGAAGGPSIMDPLLAMPTCTSTTTWTSGNKGSGSMNPGMACISCHSMGEGPAFNIAGTVYPTGHEPDKCNSLVGTDGARIVIIGADGKMLTLTPNGVGNFSSNTAIKTPYQAKVTYQGRERLMQAMQTSGDCNSCHTQVGAKMAPGRITVP